ncbi:MAG: T9SS type A sorting domain-containing protein [Bacteroidota bacterium]
MRYLCFFHLLTLLSPLLLCSQTIITTGIGNDTSWNLAGSPYHIINDIYIGNGATLTIEAGVEVLCDSNVQIYILGSLIANGTATDSIYIGSLNEALIGDLGPDSHYDWKGFVMYQGSSVQMEYVLGGMANEFFLPILAYDSMILDLSHCHFTENKIFTRLFDATHSSIQQCEFSHSRYVLYNVEHANIQNCVFRNIGDSVQTSVLSIYTLDNQFVNCQFIDIQAQVRLRGGLVDGCEFFYENYVPGPIVYSSIALDAWGAQSPTVIQNSSFFTVAGITVYSSPPGLSINNNEICTSVPGRGIILYNSDFFPTPLDVSNNCWCSLDTGYINQQVFDSMYLAPASNIVMYPVDSFCVPTSVFPGDANHDQVANHSDLLPIGLHFGSVGPVRTNASLNWLSQPADAWGDSLLATGVDLKHVDCDGNGIINEDDTLAIHLNYLQTHNGYKTSSGSVDGIPLYFEMPSASANPGDTLSIPIMLGTIDTPAVQLYGLAFSVQYDSSTIDQSLTQVDFGNSWLGTKETNMLTFSRNLDSLQQIDLALVRINQMDTMGIGQIAEIIVVIDDDIFKRDEPLRLSFANVEAIDASGKSIDLDIKVGISAIQQTDTLTNAISPALSQLLQVYPNPAEKEIVLRLDHHPIQSVSLLNPLGQIGKSMPLSSPDTSIKLDISSFPKGLYLLKVHTEAGEAVRKLMIR